jgi:hypothetical protein
MNRILMGSLVVALLVLSWSNLQAQDITNTLGGTAETDEFIVEDSSSSPLLVVEGNGEVGITTADPAGRLHVLGPNGTTGQTPKSGSEVIIEDNGSITLQFLGDNDGTGKIFFGDTEDNDIGRITYDHDNNDLAFVVNTSEAMTIDSESDVGIGDTTPFYRLEVHDNTDNFVVKIENEMPGDSTADVDGLVIDFDELTDDPGNDADYIMFKWGADVTIGSIDGDANGNVRYNTSSDIRLKRDIHETELGIDDLLRVRVRDFAWIRSGRPATGFVAQELNEVYPQAVSATAKEDEFWGVDYGKITPLIVKAVQDQQAMIRKQKEQVEGVLAVNQELKQRISEQQARIEALETENRAFQEAAFMTQTAEFDRIKADIRLIKERLSLSVKQ